MVCLSALIVSVDPPLGPCAPAPVGIFLSRIILSRISCPFRSTSFFNWGQPQDLRRLGFR